MNVVKLHQLPPGARFADPDIGFEFEVERHDSTSGNPWPDIMAIAHDDSDHYTLCNCDGSTTGRRGYCVGDVFRFPGELEVDEFQVDYVDDYFWHRIKGLYRTRPELRPALEAIAEAYEAELDGEIEPGDRW